VNDPAILTGSVVLLALEDSFLSGYVERVLVRAGAEVVSLASADLSPPAHLHGRVSACVAGPRHGLAMCSLVAQYGEPTPALLIIDAEIPENRPQRCDRLLSPFAAHQVVKAIAHLLAEAGSGLVVEADCRG